MKITISLEPSLEITSTQKDYFKAIEDLMYGYFSYLKNSDKKAVIAIDEFQKIVSLSDAQKIEELLRTIVIKRTNCSFIFTGSKRNMLLSLFNRSDRPSFKLGKEYALGLIDFDVFYKWTKERFSRKNIFLDEEAFKILYDSADGETRFVQMVSYELFKELPTESVIVASIMQRYIDDIIKSKNDLGVLLDTYTTVQQNTLKIIARTNGIGVYAKDILDEFGITKSACQSAIRSLTEKGIIFEQNNEFQFEDVEFKLWLQSL